MIEYIICASNHYNDGQVHIFQPNNIKSGFITCGHRHHNCINTFAMIVGFPYSKKSQLLQNTEIQGFLTNTNRFVNREEAKIIARNANQIPNEERISPIGLHSEDLY